jgi:hypothetical protein
MTKARDLANLISGGFTEADIPNLSASKITSGTFADARIAASNVSQHATSFDDNKIVNDISTLGLRVHTQENLNASNTNSASFDVFQDSSGITSLTNVQRNSNEYVSSVALANVDVSDNSTTFTDASSQGHSIGQSSARWNTASGGALGGSAGINTSWNGNGYVYINNTNSFIHQMGSSDFTVEMFIKSVGSTNHHGVIGYDDSGVQAYQFATNPGGTNGALYWWGSNNGSQWNLGNQERITDDNMNGNQNSWQHVAVVRNGNNFYGYSDGSRRASWTGSGALVDENSGLRIGATGNVTTTNGGYIDQVRISNTARYTAGTYTIPSGTSGYTDDANTQLIIGSRYQQLTASATGSFEGNAITAASSTSKMGAVITYQDNAGTNALNTDIIMKLSADNGSNFSTATLTALPDFATGIKMAKVNDLSVTAGTQLKYKLEFANQASGSKEARIRGVSLQY